MDLKEYFTLYPHLGDGLPAAFNTFLFGLRFPYAEGRDVLQLIMTEGSARDSDETSVLLVLTYLMKLPTDIEFESVFHLLGEAHERLEDVFQGCLKDTLRARFEGREG